MNTMVERFTEQLGGRDSASLPGWAQALRERDRQRFRSHGLPHRRLEDWKYTPLDDLAGAVAGLGAAAREGAPGAITEDAFEVEGAVHLRLVDGALRDRDGDLPEGVRVTALVEALDADDGGLRGTLEGLDTEHPSRSMAALNTADLGKGLVISVQDGVDAGCLVLHWRSSADGRALLNNTRVMVRLGDGATLDLVEDFRTGGALNGVNQFELAAGSRLRHARLQDSAAGSWLITRTELGQGADSVFEQVSLDLGQGLTRHDLRNRLSAPGASCTLSGAYLPTGTAHVDHHLDVRHEAPRCHSEQTYRGVLHDQGRAVFNGRVHVLPGADDSEAHQSNQNLLLSREAEVDTKPELIIEADEVVASHGATVGQLDESAVFYLRSRGIAEDAARRMLTGAFCRSVVDAMGITAARTAFHERLEAHLEGRS